MAENSLGARRFGQHDCYCVGFLVPTWTPVFVMAKTPGSGGREKLETNANSMWAARFWHGMLFTAWIRLLVKTRLAINPLKLPLASTVTFASVFNSVMRP